MTPHAAQSEAEEGSHGLQVVNVELPNFMFFAGKSYRRYASPMNASLLHFPGGELHGDTLMRQVVSCTPCSGL